MQKVKRAIKDVAHMSLARFRNERKYGGRSRTIKLNDTLSDNEKTYDVGIVGLWYGKNYGSILTYYALYQLVEQLGYKAVMLDKPPALWDDSFNDEQEIAQKFIRSHCDVAERCETMLDERNMNFIANTFLLGSDVVWNYEICGRQAGHFFFLDFVDGNRKKIAFASSLGAGLDAAPDDYKRAVAAYLRDFDYLSVREMNALDILQDQFKVSAEHVLDPVFLVNKKTYDEIADAGKLETEPPYIMSYVLGPDMNKMEIQNHIESVMSIPTVSYKNPNEKLVKYTELGHVVANNIDVEDWMRCIRDCELFFGDSFHGLCFSLIFHRPFIIYVHPDIAGLARFESVLAECGLSDRLVFSNDPERQNKIDQLLATQIDWNDVDDRLAPHKERSEQWLKNALAKKRFSFWKKHAK